MLSPPFPFPLPLLLKSASLTGQNATRPSSPPAIARDPSQTSERRGPIADEKEEEGEEEIGSLFATTFPWRRSTALSLPSAVAATAKTPPGHDEGGSSDSPAT